MCRTSKFLHRKGHTDDRRCNEEYSGYIKDKSLQLQDDKRKFRPNKELAKLFGLKPADVKDMTFVEINKHVSQHLTKSA